jgi:uncharacterized protein YdeI (YjbR/CyaY-like superfamily)
MNDSQTDPRVDAYIENAAPFAQPILQHLRELLHQGCPRISETIKWRLPFFQQRGVIVAHMAAFTKHCVFGFWGPEMKKIFEKDGLESPNSMGPFARIESLRDLPSDAALLRYIRQAADLVDSGERTKSLVRPKKKLKPFVVPKELALALKKSKMASKVFARFSSTNRRDYAEWIATAKRPETKKKRVLQAVEWIAQGKPRNWKYMNC